VLDVRARTITDSMALAAAHELVRCAEARGLRSDAILPTMDDWEVAANVAAATGVQAQAEGVARLSMSREQLYAEAVARISNARRATSLLMREALIAPPPP
jgi:malate dehydrogenase (oxaloacetate-decarboxylating)